MANETPLNKSENFVSTHSNFQSAEFLQATLSILESMDEAMLIVDKTWKVQYVNSTACQLFKKSKEFILDQDVWGIFPKNVGNTFCSAYKKAVEKEKKTVELKEYIPELDQWLYFQVFSTESGIAFLVRDKKENEGAVQVMEQYYRILFDEHPDAVCSVDLNGRFLSINSAFNDLFLVEGKDLIGRPFLPFVPENKKTLAEELFEYAKSGKPKSVQLNFSKEFGYPFSIMVTAIPIVVNTRIMGAYGIIKDVTSEQKNIEDLHRLYQMNQLIMESVEDGILGIDRELNVVMWNDAAERMTGYKKEEFNESKLKELLHYFNTTDMELLKKGFSRSSKITKDTVLRRSGATFFRKDGTPFLCEYTITPMVAADEIVGSVLTFRDITEKKKSEEMLRQSEKLSAVGQLAAGIAHEIRNPLTSLKGFLQLIEINKGGKKEYYDIMRTEFGRIENILNELLILSKPQTKERLSVNLKSLLKNTITLLNTQAIIKNIEIVSNFPEEDIQIYCIEHQIKQVFINIIKNAIEAMDSGGKITVRLKNEGCWAIIQISDEGCGISSEELQRLGNPFFTTKENGTGLGLMVTYQILEEHGGKVEIDSKVGEGTTFSLSLPL